MALREEGKATKTDSCTIHLIREIVCLHDLPGIALGNRKIKGATVVGLPVAP